MEKTYWNSNGTFQATYQELYAALVPNSGSCANLEGELLRASCKLYYDYYNNGMCNNTSGPARFISRFFDQINAPENVQTALREIYLESNTGGYTDINLENQLELLADFIIAYVAGKNGEYQAFSGDMWDLSEPDNYDDEDDDEYGYDEEDNDQD